MTESALRRAPWRLGDPLLLAAAVAAGLSAGPLGAGLVAGLGATLHACAVAHPRCPYYLPVHHRCQGDGRTLALTCDDGPWPAATPAILDALAAHKARATFFVIGRRAADDGPLLRRMLAAGHALGLHGHEHARTMNCWGIRRLREDLRRCAATVADATGVAPPRLFRPPMGLKNPLLGRVCAEMGLRCVTWSASARDGGRPVPAARIFARLERHLRPGAILTLHDGCEPGRDHERHGTVAAMSAVLERLAALGLRSGALRAEGAGLLAA